MSQAGSMTDTARGREKKEEQRKTKNKVSRRKKDRTRGRREALTCGSPSFLGLMRCRKVRASPRRTQTPPTAM